jgi:hypothetical protein
VFATSGFSPWKFLMPRYDKMTSTGSHTDLSSFYKIGLRDSEMQGVLVFRIHETLIPNFLRIYDMRPKWMNGSDFSWDFHYENSRTLVLVTPNFTNAEIPMATLSSDFSSSCSQNLNLMQLPANLTTDGYLNEI